MHVMLKKFGTTLTSRQLGKEANANCSVTSPLAPLKFDSLKLAEIAGQYLKKGSRAYFEGRLQTRSWHDDSGKKNYRTEIVAENLIMLSPKGSVSGDQDYSGGISHSAPSRMDESPVRGEEKISVEDLPF